MECPVTCYRLGKLSHQHPQRPRLVKVILPTRFHWRLVLANVRLLRGSPYSHVFVRKSMTSVERQREFELRQIARERNNGKANREWVVYKRLIDTFVGINSKKRRKPLNRHGSRTLECFLLNSRSICNKFDHLHYFLCVIKPDILSVTETWLTERVLDSEIMGYFSFNIFRFNPNGGGARRPWAGTHVWRRQVHRDDTYRDVCGLHVLTHASGFHVSTHGHCTTTPVRIATANLSTRLFSSFRPTFFRRNFLLISGRRPQ